MRLFKFTLIGITSWCLTPYLWSQSAFMKPASGDLTFRHQDFVKDVGGNAGNRYWTDFNFSYDSKAPFQNSELKIDTAARFNDASGFMFSIKEAQMTHIFENSELSYGRVLVDWVEVDRIWGLGKINNRVNFDFFDPGQEGLTGIRFKHSFSRYLMLDVFASYLHVPEMNPALRIDSQNRSISSRNPWAEAPERRASLDGSEFDIFYDVNEPSVRDIVLQETIGLNLQFSPTEFIHLTGYYIRKPENNLTNTANLEIETTEFNAIVDVFPQSYMHQVYGGQLTGQFLEKTLDAYVSYVASRPGRKPAVDSQFEQIDLGLAFQVERQDEEYLGTGFHWRPREDFSLSIGYLSRISSFVRTSILAKRPRWTQSVNMAFEWLATDKLILSGDIKYDTVTFDRLYMFDLSYRMAQRVRLSTGFNVIGTTEEADTFWAPFRTNDAVYAAVGYLF